MMHATAVLAAGTWSGPAADSVLIDFDRRHPRHIQLVTECGGKVLLTCEPATLLPMAQRYFLF